MAIAAVNTRNPFSGKLINILMGQVALALFNATEVMVATLD